MQILTFMYKMLYFESSDDDIEELLEVLEIPKTIDYFEDTVQRLSEEQYMQHFRVSRETTQQLSQRFEHSQYYNYQQGSSEKISPLKSITTFLWFASNEAASFRVVADRFGISKSSLHKCVHNVIYFISNLSPEFIKWPTDEEKIEIERYFREKQFPGIIGAIDGTHVRIDKPIEDPDSYLNRKHFHSIQAQVICDHTKKIRDIFVGYPGSVHDSRVLRTSPIYEALPEKCQHFMLLGDSGYPCLRQLLTPFKDRGNLTRRQRNYNYLLSKNQYIVEHCFGLLKQRFRQLYHIKLRNIVTIVHFIRACAVLHNLCLEDNWMLEDVPEYVEPRIAAFGGDGDGDEDEIDGIIRRREIVNNLPFVLP